MRPPWRSPEPPAGSSALIEGPTRRRGAYTVEVPDVGTGHYVFDPSDPRGIRSKRLEAWGDISDFDVACDELHWHSMMLSRRGAPAEEVREMGTRLVKGRQEKRIAQRETEAAAEMAAVEGSVNSVDARVRAQEEEAKRAREREAELRQKAAEQEEQIERLRKDFKALPPRARVQVQLSIVLGVSVSFTIFDVGVVGSAFQLIPGDILWKVILTTGVALAPISTAIGIAQWMSAAELPIREGVRATRLAIVAGALGIIGIGLIVLFRAAATGEPPLPFHAYIFLAFIQSALAIAEAMLYTVYFDGKVGRALLRQIQAAERELDVISAGELGEHRHARDAHSEIGAIRTSAQKEGAKLARADADRAAIRGEEEGAAAVLTAIVEQAIVEGMQSARLAQERRDFEPASAPTIRPSPVLAPWAFGGAAIALIYLLVNGI